MGKATEQNDKLNRSVMVSIILHILVLGILAIGAFMQKDVILGGNNGGGAVIDAVMVDPSAMAQQSERISQQKTDAKQAEKRRKQEADRQAEELKQQQAAEQKKLKQQELDRLKSEDAQKKAEADTAKAKSETAKAEAAKVKADAEAAQAKADAEVQKKAAEAKQQADDAKKAAEAKKQADDAKKAAEAKQQADDAKKAAEAKKQADDAKKASDAKKAADDKKAAAEAAKQSADVDDIFSGLTSDKNTPSNNGASGGGTKAGASGPEVDGYMSQVQAALMRNFFDAQLYKGKTCTLRIKMAPDGTIYDVKAEGGDPALCQVAIAAAKVTKLPKPPSTEIYEKFKNAPIDFKPQ
ncbi:cell envelope integrity protein TolA [Budvicia diplopodorum]|uniref:cell envelope integrity protein TolA n=1 Tax=Budvicia diplopodorum TaxID=1119056 RepID=UPI00135C07FA|nr:cell envelope integrity protein TolA [Budvicia diplopodorum]